MKLLAVNVSFPVEIDYKGKKVTTGIFKSPVDGYVYVSKQNISGDRQADLKNHGGEHKAVYAFSVDEYSYWEKVLNIKNMEPGSFGENLTISGLNELEVCIGDHLKVGSCLFEITQPRVPCFKLGLKFENMDIQLFLERAAPGVYLRVLQEGFIKSGDDVVIVRQEKRQLNVKRLFKAIFDESFADRNLIFKIALEIPELSDEWKKLVTSRLTRIQNETN